MGFSPRGRHRRPLSVTRGGDGGVRQELATGLGINRTDAARVSAAWGLHRLVAPIWLLQLRRYPFAVIGQAISAERTRQIAQARGEGRLGLLAVPEQGEDRRGQNRHASHLGKSA